jgi:hypothetical protein
MNYLKKTQKIYKIRESGKIDVTISDRRSVDATSLLYFFLSTIESLSYKTCAYIHAHWGEEKHMKEKDQDKVQYDARGKHKNIRV